MSFEIGPHTVARLEAAARREGIHIHTLIEKMFEEYQTSHQDGLSANNTSDPTLDWLNARISAAPTDPEQIQEAEDDLNEVIRNMNSNSAATGERLPFPDSPPDFGPGLGTQA